eukprot:CAMPEP_0194262266 /NCGR_PEP_ID=MMETSP0158-20130606/46452_1 /TAXON_ID=33649 /ORGANISM="Thalassionema nitzschioides, Strain L26-B" /LENGTH=972 /DNA_ID=CAMNT_0039002419 /DNA_START=203 /DNA_END=3120 /DNA_ORIENTATION=+
MVVVAASVTEEGENNNNSILFPRVYTILVPSYDDASSIASQVDLLDMQQQQQQQHEPNNNNTNYHTQLSFLVQSPVELEDPVLIPYQLTYDEKQTLELFANDNNNNNTTFLRQQQQSYSTISGFPCYKNLQGSIDWMNRMTRLSIPNILEITLVDIGDSYLKTVNSNDGHDIWALQISTTTSVVNKKGTMLVMSGLHARELTPPELVSRWAEELIRGYNTNADFTSVLDSTDIHIILQANPDARNLVETSSLNRMRRKNLRRTACSNSLSSGVDLNRNFPFLWGDDSGSSSNPCSQTYRGSGPGSEPEVQAVVRYAESIFPRSQRVVGDDVVINHEYNDTTTTGIFIDVHSYGEFMVYPWGYRKDVPSGNDGALRDIPPLQRVVGDDVINHEYNDTTTTGMFIDVHSYGEFMVYPWGYRKDVPSGNDGALRGFMNKLQYINGYDPAGPNNNFPGPASGASDDWAYGTLGTPSLTLELGTSFAIRVVILKARFSNEWGYRKDVPSGNDKALRGLLNKLQYINGYDPAGPNNNFPGPASGASDDWAYGTLGTPSLTLELGTDFRNTCRYFESSILERNKRALTYAAQTSRTPYRLPLGPDVTVVETTSTNTNNGVQVTVEASDAARAYDTQYTTTRQSVELVKVYTEYYPENDTNDDGGQVMQRRSEGTNSFVIDLDLDAATGTNNNMIYVQATDSDGYTGPVKAAFLPSSSQPPTPQPTTTTTEPLVPSPFVGCFSANQTVELADGTRRNMSELKIGDQVRVMMHSTSTSTLTSSNEEEVRYEPIYSFGHYAPKAVGEFIDINEGLLQVSPSHLVLSDDEHHHHWIPASLLQVGDYLLVQQQQHSSSNQTTTTTTTPNRIQIDSIQTVIRHDGLYAPFTLSGTILVNDAGIVASTFISLQENQECLHLGGTTTTVFNTRLSFQWLSYVFESVHRLWFRLFVLFITSNNTKEVESYNEDGMSYWVALPHQIMKW